MSISNTPKRNTVVFDSNKDNDNTQTPRTPKTQISTKRNRATPSPMRNRKPLFDDTPPIQRYKVQMAKNRFDTSKNYRKEIRNIFHQSDQFATFQQKSALVVPTELTPERYILGKFNAAPEKIQKDRGISRRVTRRADLYDVHNRYSQDTPQKDYYNDNNEVLVEEIEEIDVITEEQQNLSNSSGQVNNVQSNEQIIPETHLNVENDSNNNQEHNKEENISNQFHNRNEYDQDKGAENVDKNEEEEINDNAIIINRNADLQIEEEEEDLGEVTDNTNARTNNEDLQNQLLDKEEQPENDNKRNENDTYDDNGIASENREDQNDNTGNEANINNNLQSNEGDIDDLKVIQRDADLQVEEEEQEPENQEQFGGNKPEPENLEVEEENNENKQEPEPENLEVEEEEQEPENQEQFRGNEPEPENLEVEEENNENEQENLINKEQHENEDHENQENAEQQGQENEKNENQENAEQQEENEKNENQENAEQQKENENRGDQENEDHQESAEQQEQGNEDHENQENAEQQEQGNEDHENQENAEQQEQGNEDHENQENAEQQEENENRENQENAEQQEQEKEDHESQENAAHHEQEAADAGEANQEHGSQADEDDIPVPEFEDANNGSIVRSRSTAEPFMPPSSPPRFKKLDRNDPKICHTGDQLLEISLRPYLYSLSNKYGTPINRIRDIPEMEFNDWQSMGFDWVWLYGIWQIGQYVIDHDLKESTLLNRYNEVLPDWKPEDVIGYPLCIYKYEVCPEVGSEDDLQWFRMEMKKRGIKLMLDFVPNDTAIDSPEMTAHPEFYIRSIISPSQEKDFDSNRFMKDHNGVAYGSGEFMPPMHFNAQLNLFNRKCRDYQIDRIYRVSQLCDGLRIHLAQYLINSKFATFWNNELFNQSGINTVDIDYKNENEEFWSLAISKIREENPNFVMMAESYGYENQEKLLNCGFNYVYEKELLDKLVYSDVKGFRDLIFNNEFLTSKKMVHFVENHDEARVLHRFWKNERMACAASAALLTLPGIRLINFHQWLGYMNQIDVNLRRSYEPHMNKYIMLFYVRLFRVLDTNAIRFGQWTPKNVYESDTVIAWKWVKGNQHILVTVNFSDNRSGGRVICNDAPTETREITVHELISNTYYTRDPQELIDSGLCLSLDKYETQIFEY